MKAVGIIIAKENSNRFKGKNYYEINEKPMFWHNVECLLNSEKINDVFVSTDSKKIKEYCLKSGVKVINRNINVAHNETPIFEVLKYTYQSLKDRYDIICCILANTIGNTTEDVDNAIDILVKKNFNEVRSFDKFGNETGFLFFKEKVLIKQKEISSHLGMIINKSKEIHYKEDL